MLCLQHEATKAEQVKTLLYYLKQRPDDYLELFKNILVDTNQGDAASILGVHSAYGKCDKINIEKKYYAIIHTHVKYIISRIY